MKKILLISLALVLALGTLGVAGALWQGWLYLDGYVETGDIGAQWSVERVWDNEAEGKDVSWGEVYWWGPDWIEFDIYNAYPSITYTLAWNIECTGSVPIHFDTPYLSTNLPEGATLTFTDLDGVPIVWREVQLHRGDIIEGLLTVHLDNDAEMNSSYSFYISLNYGQYNEFPPV